MALRRRYKGVDQTKRAQLTRQYRRGLAGAAAAAGCLIAAATPALASNDPLFAQQWALTGSPASVNAPQAWCASLGDGMIIADVDSGADVSHPDFRGRIIGTARFTSGDGNSHGTDVTDDVGHGTMTLGLMAGGKDDGVTIAGMAPHARLLVAKALVSDGKGGGTGNSNDVAAAVDWAVSQHANVINLSLGSNEVVSQVGALDPLGPAITRAEKAGVAVAVAAGNNGLPVGSYANSGALIVGALARSGAIASYSDSLVGVNIYAPGGDFNAQNRGDDPATAITSDAPGGYGIGVGTSFAAPHVSGTLALLMAHGYSAQAAQARIKATQNATTSGMDAAAALGTTSGCAGAPPTTNDKPAPTGSGTNRPSSGHAAAPAAPPPAAAGATPSPSPSTSASPSSSPSSSAGQAGDSNPSPRVLAHPPNTGGGGSTPIPLVAAGVVVGAGAGYAALKFLASLR